MSNEPIFDQLQAEFVEKSIYCGLRVGPPADENFKQIEVVDELFNSVDLMTKMIDIEETIEVHESPRLYIVEGAPELVDITRVANVEPTEMEQTITIPTFKSDQPKPPSLRMLDDTRILPIIKDDESTKNPTFFDVTPKQDEEKQRIFPIKRTINPHKKTGATRSFAGFFSRAA